MTDTDFYAIGERHVYGGRLLDNLARMYIADGLSTAKLCDETLDRTGNLLGYIRKRAAELQGAP
jgi:hypothetical protein